MRPWEDNIRRVTPYVPGEQPNKEGMVKLNTNENPYPPAPGVNKILQSMDTDVLRLYPDPTIKLLVEELARFYHVDNNQIFVGVGSDDVLAMAFLTFFNSEKPILFPDITYSFYPVWCELFKIPFETPALNQDFGIIIADYTKENGGIIIANPNAPTSIYEDLSVIEEIIKKNQNSIVIIDEAYIDFAGESALTLLEKYENLIIVQTFSKSRSMAGMRIGYAIGSPKLIKALNDVKYSFNSYTMNHTAIIAGAEAVKDGPYFRDGINKIITTRSKAEKELKDLGFTFPRSGSNFIFATHEKIPAKVIFESLRENNVYVRYFNLPRINNYLRISIGTEDEMKQLYRCLNNIVTSY